MNLSFQLNVFLTFADNVYSSESNVSRSYKIVSGFVLKKCIYQDSIYVQNKNVFLLIARLFISQFVSKKYVNCNEDVNVPRLGHNRS